MELKRTDLAVARERAVLVAASTCNAEVARESLEELKRLALTANALIVGELTQRRSVPDNACYLGQGKVEELRELCRQTRADVVIMDVDLTAAQVRNLERLCDRKVIDRTELILDIFARGARTAEARDQVELAQLEYTYPRLKHMWTHLERVEGGIGMRGPGERQIETDRRLVRKRIQELKERIRRNIKRRAMEVRSRSDEITACLVGYTNAGKSTLMNALTGANVPAEDKLFSTLDTRTRVWNIGEGRKILLSDTVGFIRNLPHHLIASFHATLEETRQADLLLHVVDASSLHAEQQMEAVMQVLAQLGCAEHSVITVFNKMDLVAEDGLLPLLRRRCDSSVMISAATGHGLDELRKRVREFLDRDATTVTVEMPPSAGRLLAYLAEHAEILSREYGDERVRMVVRVAPRHLGLIRKNGGRIRRVAQTAEARAGQPNGVPS